MTKTQTEILAALDNSFSGVVGFDFGLDRGTGGTGKLRAFNVRQHDALNALIAAGKVEVISRTSSIRYTKGYGSHCTTVTVRRVA